MKFKMALNLGSMSCCWAAFIWFQLVVSKLNGQPSNQTVGIQKAHTLDVLNLIPMSGDWYVGGIACTFATEIVVDAFNARRDVLPDYRIQMRYRDEVEGLMAAAETVQFSFDYDDADPEKTNVYPSPIVVGPQYSTGCTAMGPILSATNLIALSTDCTAASLAEHSRFPNLYLTLTTGKTRAIAVLKFIREIGHWNRFGIITTSEDVNFYSTALLMQVQALAVGFEVPFFDMVWDINVATMEYIKQSDIRIIVMGTSYAFLCDAYAGGIRGDRYTFIGDLESYVSPDDLQEDFHPTCVRKQYEEQLLRTVWIGDLLEPLDSRRNETSDLGHTWPQLDAMLYKLTNNTEPDDWVGRYLCYDATVHALLALDGAEQDLKKRLNMSLRDYQEHPRDVASAVNSSLIRTKIKGLRSGIVSFSSVGQLDNDVHTIAVWSRETKKLENFYLFHQYQSSKDFRYDSYYLEELQKFKPWMARDRPLHKFVEVKVSRAVFIVAIVVAGLDGLLQLGGILFLLIKIDNTYFPYCKMLGLVGCLGIDAAAVLLTFPDIDAKSMKIGIGALVMGTALVHSLLTTRPAVVMRDNELNSNLSLSFRRRSRRRTTKITINASSEVHFSTGAPATRMMSNPQSSSGANLASVNNNQTRGSTARLAPAHRPPSVATGATVVTKIADDTWTAYDKSVSYAGLAIFGCYGWALTGWLVAENFTCVTIKDVTYQEQADTFLEKQQIDCSSEDMQAWVIGMVFSQELMLLAGTFFAYRLGHIRLFCPEIGFIRAGAANSATLLLVSVLIGVVLRNQLNQRQAIAFISLVLSFTSSLTFIIPSITNRNNFIVEPS